MTLREYLKSLADKIRYVCGWGEDELINAQNFTFAIDDVYNAGYEAGQQSGGGNTDEAFENGQKEMWKCTTANGTRKNYHYAFQYTDLNYFEPKTDISPTVASYMFAYTNGSYVDLEERFERNGTSLDFSNTTNFTRTFYNSGVTRLGVIDCRSATALDFTFGISTQLHTIDKLIVDADNTYSNTFSSDSALENIEIEGEIGNNISFGSCKKLTHDSLMSIINHLQEKTSGTFTLTLSADSNTKLTDEERAKVTDEKRWTLL